MDSKEQNANSFRNNTQVNQNTIPTKIENDGFNYDQQ